MRSTKMVTLLLAVLALVAVGHHQLAQMSKQALNTQLVPAADAAVLQASSGVGDSCNGTGTWHFVNPQNGGDCEPLHVVFSCGNVTQNSFMCLNHNTNYSNITTSGNCTLGSASNSAPGKIVLSDLFCASATPTPTPSPAPSPTP
jgi:hypothetical protein